MIIVVVRDEDGVDKRQILRLTWRIREALRAHHVVRSTALLQNRVKQGPQATRKLDIVGGMTQPGCAEGWGLTCREEFGFANRDRRATRIGDIAFAVEATPRSAGIRQGAVKCCEYVSLT